MNPNPNKVWVLVQDITWMHGKVFLFLIKIDQIFIHIPLKHFFFSPPTWPSDAPKGNMILKPVGK